MKKSKKKQMILEMIFRAANLWQQRGGKMPGGLTLRQFMLLATMKNMPQTNLTSLSKAFGGTRQNIRQLVNALYEKGYVQIGQSETDRREIRVGLTDKAKEYFAENENADDDLLQPVFKGIGEKSMDGAMECLEKIIANLENLHGEPEETKS